MPGHYDATLAPEIRVPESARVLASDVISLLEEQRIEHLPQAMETTTIPLKFEVASDATRALQGITLADKNLRSVYVDIWSDGRGNVTRYQRIDLEDEEQRSNFFLEVGRERWRHADYTALFEAKQENETLPPFLYVQVDTVSGQPLLREPTLHSRLTALLLRLAYT
jgi:hypothetical protein